MHIFIIAGLVVLATIFLVRWFLRADPAVLAWGVKWFFIVALLLGLALLIFSGRIGTVLSYSAILIPMVIPILFRAKRDESTEESQHYHKTKMTTAEAYEILDLKPGASRSDITKAYHRLMKKVHPDHGGSSYMAQKLNQAKAILLGKL